jgi:uncharacterized protein (UPF0276 family)
MERPPFLGHGVGLRRDHHERILSGPTRIDWFEVISENFMRVGGRARWVLDRVRASYPVVLHGVSLSIGSTDPLDEKYLADLADLAASVEPAWVSDHLCWTGAGGHNAHDLLPLPYTEEALAHVVNRVKRVQDCLKRRIALENVSSYMSYRLSTMPEWEFLSRVAEEADCGILLDVNNVYVSSFNHRFDPREYLAAIPVERVFQFHLAGHSRQGELLLDTHDHPVPDPVWALYDEAVARFGPVSTLVEWDDRIPPFEELEAQRNEAAERQKRVLGEGIPEAAGKKAVPLGASR